MKIKELVEEAPKYGKKEPTPDNPSRYVYTYTPFAGKSEMIVVVDEDFGGILTAYPKR